MRSLLFPALMSLSMLLSGCAALGPRKTPLGIEKKDGGIEYKVTLNKWMGLEWKDYDEVQSKFEDFRDDMGWLSKVLLFVGAGGAILCVALAVVLHGAGFLATLCRKLIPAFVVCFAGGLFLSALATWLTWVLLAALAILIGWLIHNRHEFSLFGLFKQKGTELKQKVKQEIREERATHASQ